MTLRPAFAGGDRQELLGRIAQQEPTAPRRLDPAIPIDLETIVLKALAKEPGRRYATAQELADDLGRFLEGRTIRARRPTLRDRAIKLARRYRAVVISAIVVCALVIVGLVAGLTWSNHWLRSYNQRLKREIARRKRVLTELKKGT